MAEKTAVELASGASDASPAPERPAKRQRVDGSEQPPAPAPETETKKTSAAAAPELPEGAVRRKAPRDVLIEAGIPLVDSKGAPLTKSAIKKLSKKIEWEAAAPERRQFRREERKRKKSDRKQKKAEAVLSGEQVPVKAPRPEAQQVPIAIIIDCSYNDLMTEQEVKSLVAQITRSYSDNTRTSQYKVHLAVSSWSGTLRERFEQNLQGTYKNWKGVRFFEEDFVEVAKMSKEWMKGPDGGKLLGALSADFAIPDTSTVTPEISHRQIEDPDSAEGETVYFSSDSSRTIGRLAPYGTYIIGGLVDRNRHKGVCHRKAVAKGVATAQLPIGEFLRLGAVNVLATNHVNEIALRWLEMGNWADALLRVMPKRKGAQLLEHIGRNGGGESEGEAELEEEAESEAEAEEAEEEEAAGGPSNGQGEVRE